MSGLKRRRPTDVNGTAPDPRREWNTPNPARSASRTCSLRHLTA